MKTLGILGGMSWQSTASYYAYINKEVQKSLGGLHSAKIVLYSFDFAEIAELQRAEKWDHMATLLSTAAVALEKAGAEAMLVSTNTMHKVAPQIESAISIPLLHIADAVAEVLIADGIQTIGLLGTRFTMEREFYTERLLTRHGLRVLTPDRPARDIVNRVIFSELCVGKQEEDSRRQYLTIIDQLHSRGAEAVILACTEIGLLVSSAHTSVPLYDTAIIHAKKALTFALSA